MCVYSSCNQHKKVNESRIYLSSISCFDEYESNDRLLDQNPRLFSKNILFIDSVNNKIISQGNIPEINEDIFQVNYEGEINSEVKNYIDSLWEVKWVNYNLKSRSAYRTFVRENGLLYLLSPIYEGKKSNSYYVLLMSSTKHLKVINVKKDMECEILWDSDY